MPTEPSQTVIVIKKKAKGHGHHGGAWKVAYADFVTAMMALFMVLWLLSQTDQEARKVISEYFRTGVLSDGIGINDGLGDDLGAALDSHPGSEAASEDERLERSAELVRQRIEEMVEQHPNLRGLADSVDVEVTREGLLIQIFERSEEEVAFDVSSAALKPALQDLLQQLAPVFGALPNSMRIDGHTDARPFPDGSARSNWDLSFARADRARAVLEAHGVRDGQVVGVLAHGSSDLLLPDDPWSSKNRRLTILAVRAAGATESTDPEPPLGDAPWITGTPQGSRPSP
jgi:chemotaxis protein MotB